MRAAMFMPGLRPGSTSWTIYQDLAAAVRALGHDFEVWTDGAAGGPAHEHTRLLPPAGSWGMDGLVSPLLRSRRLLGTARTVARELRRQGGGLDLLYGEIAYPYGTALALARRLAGWDGKLVVKPTGEDVLTLPEASYGFGRYPVPRWLTDWTLRTADALRCISPLVVDAIDGRTDRPRRTIPSSVTAATVAAAHRPADEVAAARRRERARVDAELDLAEAPLILSLGRLHPFKGLDRLVRALADLPRASLVIVGPSLDVAPHGDQAAYLRRLADELDVADRTHLVGPVPHAQVAATLAAADVVVVPSLLESMNKVCVESAAAGTPFVTTETTGISHFLRSDHVGLVVPPDRPTALAQAISAVIDGDWRFDPGAAADFVDQFAPTTVAPQLVDLFQEAVE